MCEIFKTCDEPFFEYLQTYAHRNLDPIELAEARGFVAAQRSKLALNFESLGGGSLNPHGWAFGCEFGFFQRHCGTEPLGLLRWASVAPADLLRGLHARFVGVDDPETIRLREHTGADWGLTQATYGLYIDHTGMDRTEVSHEVASAKLGRGLGFLARKLIADLTTGEKLFIYHTYDHRLSTKMVEDLADAVACYGPSSTFCYVHTEGKPFVAERLSPNLIVATIDHFAPQVGEWTFNWTGWLRTCEAIWSVHNVVPNPAPVPQMAALIGASS